MALRRIVGPALAAATALQAGPAGAAGGAHVVDDASVEAPDTCHLETWITRSGPGRGLVNASPGCTLKMARRLELDGTVQYLADHPADAMIGPAAKLTLRPAATGLGVAVEASAQWSVRSGRPGGAGVIVPVTWEPDPALRLNLNAGWSYVGGGAPHPRAALLGAQVEYQVNSGVALMAEVFGRSVGRPGEQVGVRWTPGTGEYDLDLLYGRRVDGVSRNAVTLGLTYRR